MTPEERLRVVDAFARALYAVTFQMPIEESADESEAWRVWREEATRVLDKVLAP
jgi:hypothetical protein